MTSDPSGARGIARRPGRQADVDYGICITPVHRSVQPSSAFTRGERSNSRPAMYGPRSTTGTVTVFAPCVSVTIVPHGSDFSKKPGPYHDTVTTLPFAAAGIAVISIGTAATRAGAGGRVEIGGGSAVGAATRERATGSGSRGSSYCVVTC